VLHLENFQLNVDKQQLVSNIHFNLNGQEKIGIIGQNGIGKSSFLKLIYQELRQRADINLGYMPQRYSEVLDESKTPLDFLLENGNREQEQLILTHLASLQFTRQEVHHRNCELSGEQKAKLLLLKMVLDQANFLLLDEPVELLLSAIYSSTICRLSRWFGMRITRQTFFERSLSKNLPTN
jgi:ATPase subunit of ABC transporter with duplicated ATPase domains